MSVATGTEIAALRAVESRVLGTRIHGVDLGQAATWIDAWAQSGVRAHVATVNPEFVMRARRDADFHDLLECTRLNVPDGVGVVVAGRLGGKRIPTQMQMAACTPLRNRECGVEEQYARIRPASKIAHCGRASDIVVKLAEDVSE